MAMAKRVLALFVSVLLITSLSVPAFAADSKGELTICTGEQMNLKATPLLPNSEPRYEDLQINSLVASISVNVTEPCDQLFRDTYSSYAYEANRTVERTDDYLYDEFGIDFTSVAQPLWTSPDSTDPQTLIDDAIADHGLTYNGTQTADIMMAFSGADAVSGSSTVFGVTYTGDPYACMFDNGYTQNCKSCQHEFGHTYGLGHHTGTGACVMKQGWDLNWDNFEHLCTTHWDAWDDAKNNY